MEPRRMALWRPSFSLPGLCNRYSAAESAEVAMQRSCSILSLHRRLPVELVYRESTTLMFLPRTLMLPWRCSSEPAEAKKLRYEELPRACLISFKLTF